MSGRAQYNNVGGARPGRSVFDLSYSKTFTCDMGQLIPIMADEVVPGDIFKIGVQKVVRMQPLVAPILHEIYVTDHYFFVPNRLLMDEKEWFQFITGGPDGDDTDGITPGTEVTLPTWQVTGAALPAPFAAINDNGVGSLWDYFGFPTGVVPAGAYPLDFPKRAYNLIWNEYYRDQNFVDPIDIETSEQVLYRAWQGDYFTKALPWQQRGTAPALPVSGSSAAVFSGDVALTWPAVSPAGATNAQYNSFNNAPFDAGTKSLLEGGKVLQAAANANTVDFSSASTFDISDLRLAFQTQRWLERNARCGVRYNEFVKAHYNVDTGDSRINRPEYIGGAKNPIIVSEVLQTSATEAAVSPQGNLAGHGITAGNNFIGSYRAKEHGWIIGIQSIMAVPLYQQGIDRQFLRSDKLDYYFPEFANLSEQGIEMAEIYATGVEAENKALFGYIGRYDEMRTKRNMVCGQMRDTFDYWHLSRQFSSAPMLNESFLYTSKTSPRKDIFAASDEPGFIVSHANKIKAIRPMPFMSNPGMIDH